MAIPDAAPARLGRYELVARLATGGMGEIFLARLEGAAGFEKLFVIKRILPHLAGDIRFRDMLIAEARIASVMAHANICQVYELGETDGQLYIAMEYLEGITLLPLLHRLSKEGRSLELGFAGGVIQQAIEGLHYAHELKDRSGSYLGIVHRDVTPSNIFLTDAGIAKILDFGIAKVKTATARTQTGTVKGKYAYMAPEQLRGAAIDRRADVFALGIVLFEMLALRRLFQRKTDYLTFRAVMEQPIPDLRVYRPDCPPALALAVARALDRDPDRRFATARQFGSAVLDAISQHQRLWTHGEIGDFVTSNFADDIQQRGAQIASAVTGALRRTIPVIMQPEELEVSTENEFPPVDSVLDDAPVLGAASQFGSDDTQLAASPELAPRGRPGPTVPPAMTTDPQAVAVVAPRRSLLWPVVAFAMVAIAGGALYLVWESSRSPKVVINPGSGGRVATMAGGIIQVGPDEPGPSQGSGRGPDAEPGGAGSAGGGDAELGGSDGGSDGEPGAGTARKSVDAGSNAPATVRPPDGAVVTSRKPQVDRCVGRHGDLPPGTRLVIRVAPSGQPRSLTIDPGTVASMPIGACVRSAFKSVVFRPSRTEREIEVQLEQTKPAAGKT